MPPFPFSAIVGQDEMRQALLIAAVDPTIGGVLVFGDRGTGKSTAIRALAALLPPMAAVAGCPYNCDPASPADLCPHCAQGGPRKSQKKPVPVVDLPLGATEDRVVGILDVAASGINTVEREGLSLRHPARFVLVGSGNPEEGELRPQLLDRFGLACEVATPKDIATRIAVVRARDAYERDPEGFCATHAKDDAATRKRIEAARKRLPGVSVPDDALEQAARLCLALGTDGLRGELTLMRTARALAALDGAGRVTNDHLLRIAPAALRHRLRRNPLDESGSTARVERALAEVFS